jgi:L-threonylcarbamoyladenylate synthase
MQYEFTEEVRSQIEKGSEIIRQGGVIAFPTDTVYGLGAGAYIESAIERVYKIKNRLPEMSLPLLVGDVAQVHEVADYIPAYGWRLIDRFWPGGLTLVVYRARVVKDIITGGGDTVAIRMPNHPIPCALIKSSGMPVIGTSANVSGQPAVTTAAEVRLQMDGAVDFIIDGGPAPQGVESTVVDITGEVAVILRQGAIAREDIERVTEVA